MTAAALTNADLALLDAIAAPFGNWAEVHELRFAALDRLRAAGLAEETGLRRPPYRGASDRTRARPTGQGLATLNLWRLQPAAGPAFVARLERTAR